MSYAGTQSARTLMCRALIAVGALAALLNLIETTHVKIGLYRSLPQGKPQVVELTLNGARQTLENGLTINQLLERLSLSGKRLAVERNGEIVPKTEHSSVYLEDGDRLEIVVAVGGG